MQISPLPLFRYEILLNKAQVGMNHIMQPVLLLGKIAETCTLMLE